MTGVSFDRSHDFTLDLCYNLFEKDFDVRFEFEQI